MTDSKSHSSWIACQVVAQDEADTCRWAEGLAELLVPGMVVALDGPLGAGKTRFVRALAAALGVEQSAVTSPTFVLVQEYEGRLPLVHVDAYRLRGPEEFVDLGGEEYLSSGAVTLIEWADRLAPLLPADRLSVRIEVVDTERRRIVFSGAGQAAAAVRGLIAAGAHELGSE